jgi:Ca2+-binding RTX toxin-like protein
MAATIIRIKDEQSVNTEQKNNQFQPSVTKLAEGGWVVTWTSLNQDGSFFGIYQQRYDASGAAVGDEQQVNTEWKSFQYEPSVTGLADGGWVVTWTSRDQDGEVGGIYQRYYDKDGVAKDEERVNSETADHQGEPSVTALSDGGWVVTWSSVNQDGSYEGIFQQRYDADGVAVDGEQQVNTYTDDTQWRPSATGLVNGGWVVTWASIGQDDEEEYGEGIYQSFRDANDNVTVTKVNTVTAGNQTWPSVTALDDGGWIITWTCVVDGAGNGKGIFQQRYSADGSPREGEQQVNTDTNGFQNDPSVTALSDGGWLVTWTSTKEDDEGDDIHQQRYDKNGNAVGGEQQVNIYAANGQNQPSVTGLEDGGWLVTWASAGQDGSDYDVFQRHYMSVAAFGEGQEQGIGTDDNDVFQVRNGGLTAGDSLDGGDGNDTLAMIEAGTLDLTAPDVFTGIEIIQGSSGNDIIVTSEGRLSGLTAFHGGDGTDALHLRGGSHDLSDVTFSGMEAITLTSTGSLTFDDKATALLAHSQTHEGTVILTGGSFTLAERTQLYHQGFRAVTDAGGVHVLQQAQISLSQEALQENAANGTSVGTFSATDPNPRDGLRFELIDTAGGRFALSGNKLVVANGSLLDYESGTSHRIVVRVVDEGGLATEAAFTITLGDLPVETIKGTTRADRLTGGTGQDVLFGGLGKDTLTGDAGSDIFVFDTKPNKKTNLDKITDFNVKDDTIWLDNKAFAKLGKKGTEAAPAQLKKDFFVKGSKAKDKNDYVIYDSKKGVLFYDADGSGKGKQVEIATLSKKLAMTYKDFFVI